METKSYYLWQDGEKLYLMPEGQSMKSENNVGIVVTEDGNALDVSDKDDIGIDELVNSTIMVNKKYKGGGKTVTIGKCFRGDQNEKENIYRDKGGSILLCIKSDTGQVSESKAEQLKKRKSGNEKQNKSQGLQKDSMAELRKSTKSQKSSDELRPKETESNINWNNLNNWNNFNSELSKSQWKDVRDLIKRYWLLLNRIMIIYPSLNLESSMNNPGIPSMEQNFFELVLESMKSVEEKEEDDKKIFTEEILKKFDELRKDLFSEMNNYLNTTGEQRNKCWDKIKDIINNQFDMLERKLVNISQNRTQTEDTHEVEAEKEKLEKRGFIKRTAGRVVKFVKDTRDSITKKPVKLTLDTNIVNKFVTMVDSINSYATCFNSESNSPNKKNLKDEFKTVFSGSKSTYRSWYNYVYDIVCDIDKCIKAYHSKQKNVISGVDYSAWVLESVQISLMYVFVRSMLHCDLKNVNSIREGIKQFVLMIDNNISSKQDVSAFEKNGKAPKEVMQAGTKTRQLCKDVKSNMNEVLARQKSLRDVLKKEECKKILDFITDTTYKNKLKQKIVK